MIEIDISQEAIERAETLLKGIPKGTERAFASAINRAVAHSKTRAFQEVTKIYEVRQKDLKAKTAARVQKANTGDIAGYVLFSGVKIPLYEFKVSKEAPKKSKHIKAAVMKEGGWTAFRHAFIAQMDSGHIGIFERVGAKRTPIQEIMGLSGAQMVKNEDIIDKLSEEAQEKVNERVIHEIERILNGYGG